MCFLPAVLLVDHDLARALGQLPSTSESELNRGWVGSTEKPRCGAPPKLITLPLSPIRFAVSATPPIAAWTSGSAFTFGSSDSSNGGRFWVASALTADLPVIDGVGALVDAREDRVERAP